MNDNPYFSVIIPTYNRANLVKRAVNSVLSQTFIDYELIIVDDCSEDETIEVLNEINDSRIRIIKHQKNSGVSVARNTGIENSRGKWVFPFDSDDALLPQALNLAYNESLRVDDSIGMIRFLNQLESGLITPIPVFQEGIWDFKAYLKWAESMMFSSNTDSCKIIKKSCFDIVKYPNSRALETEFHINFSFNFFIKCCPIPLLKVYLDANSRLSIPSSNQLTAMAEGTVLSNTRFLRRYKNQLKTHSPLFYNRKLSNTAFCFFLLNQKKKGLKYSIKSILHKPFLFRNYLIIVGVFSKDLLLQLKKIKAK